MAVAVSRPAVSAYAVEIENLRYSLSSLKESVRGTQVAFEGILGPIRQGLQGVQDDTESLRLQLESMQPAMGRVR